MHGLFMTAGLLLAGLLAYAFRKTILAALARFDARNAERRFEEMRDRHDRNAHFKHTLRLAEEQVDAVTEIAVADERTGAPVTRFLFAGETFLNRADAEEARKAAIFSKAREFYVELPNALTRRGDGKLR